jgi:hypothetical protein
MFEEYKAFKEKVGVDDVAAYLGYKLDRKAGVGKYVEYNIRDGRGRKIDSIVISHPGDKSSQTYFHRNGASGGDAISLIKANINSFGVTGSSEAEMLAAVMSKLTSDDTFITKAEDRYKDMKPQVFDIKRFQMEASVRRQNCLGENPQSRLLLLTDTVYPRLKVTMGGNDAFREPMEIEAEEFVGVKSVKAHGKRVTTFAISLVEELEPTRYPETDKGNSEGSSSYDSDESELAENGTQDQTDGNEDPDAGKSQQDVADELTGQLHLFD